MIRPGPISPATARYLNEQMEELRRLRDAFERLLPQESELFPVAITTGTSGVHGWYEEGISQDGTRYSADGLRFGTPTSNPLRLADGSTLSATPTSPVKGWAREIGIAGTSGTSAGMQYELVSIPQPPSTPSNAGKTYVLKPIYAYAADWIPCIVQKFTNLVWEPDLENWPSVVFLKNPNWGNNFGSMYAFRDEYIQATYLGFSSSYHRFCAVPSSFTAFAFEMIAPGTVIQPGAALANIYDLRQIPYGSSISGGGVYFVTVQATIVFYGQFDPGPFPPGYTWAYIDCFMQGAGGDANSLTIPNLSSDRLAVSTALQPYDVFGYKQLHFSFVSGLFGTNTLFGGFSCVGGAFRILESTVVCVRLA